MAVAIGLGVALVLIFVMGRGFIRGAEDDAHHAELEAGLPPSTSRFAPPAATHHVTHQAPQRSGISVGDGFRFGCGVVLFLMALPFLTCGGCAACAGCASIAGSHSPSITEPPPAPTLPTSTPAASDPPPAKHRRSR
jgi:hypothetical protein